MDSETTAWVLVAVILYAALYGWVCGRNVDVEALRVDARVLTNTARPLSPSRSSSTLGVSSEQIP